MAQNNSEKIYLPVPELKLDDLLDWQDPDQRHHRHLVHRVESGLKVTFDPHHKKCFGNYVDLNDAAIALFRVGKEVYATQAKCPHAGGPLYMADIEELVPGKLTLTCPWHKWKFDIDTGCNVMPPRGLDAQVYPTRVNKQGMIFIGFDSFGPSAFEFFMLRGAKKQNRGNRL